MNNPGFYKHKSVGFLMLLFLLFNSSVCFAFEILTIGDSITQGYQRTADGEVYGVEEPVNGAANIGGYQPILKQKLGEFIEPSTLYNWGIGGDNSTGGVQRIGSVLNSIQADYILILFGANDLYQGISSTTTKANIRSMINQSRDVNVLPIISELSPDNRYNRYIEHYFNPKINALAEEEGTEIVLMYQYMDGKWNTFPYHSGDGLHLSNDGYNKMARLWFYAIEKIENSVPIIEPEPFITNIVPIVELLLLNKVN